MSFSARSAAWVVAIRVLASAIPTARGQDLDQPDPVPAAVQSRFHLSESNFEMWVYGGADQHLDETERLASLLTHQIDDIDRSCRLTQTQRRKLEMAGQGDIKHFQKRVTAARKIFDRLRYDQTKVGEIHAAAVPLGTQLREGLFGNRSFFAKTIAHTLNSEQLDRYTTDLHQREQFLRYRARIEQTLVRIDAIVPLSGKQQRQLITLLLEYTNPPQKWSTQQNDHTVILIKLGQIPAEKLHQVLDDSRLKVIDHLIDQARLMETFLSNQGFLDPAPLDVIRAQ